MNTYDNQSISIKHKQKKRKKSRTKMLTKQNDLKGVVCEYLYTFYAAGLMHCSHIIADSLIYFS